jgi:hypothetical protein
MSPEPVEHVPDRILVALHESGDLQPPTFLVGQPTRSNSHLTINAPEH